MKKQIQITTENYAKFKNGYSVRKCLAGLPAEDIDFILIGTGYKYDIFGDDGEINEELDVSILNETCPF